MRKNAEAPVSSGTADGSDEAAVMAVERRGGVVPTEHVRQPASREERARAVKLFGIDKRAVMEVWRHVRANRGAAGIGDESIGGPVGNTRSSHGMQAAATSGSGERREGSPDCALIGASMAVQAVGQWEPYESRGSRTVLREAAGAIPAAYRPFSAGRRNTMRWLFGRKSLVTNAFACGCSARGRSVRAVIEAILMLSLSTADVTAGNMRPWTVQDSVETAYLVENQEPDRATTKLGNAIVPSPDRRYFFFVTRRGELASDNNIYELRVYATKEVADQLAACGVPCHRRIAPRVDFTLSSASEEAAIYDAHWIDGGRAVAFIGARLNDAPQVYRIDVSIRKVRVVTRAQYGVANFEMQGRSLIYTAVVGTRSRVAALNAYPANVVDGYKWAGLLGLPDEKIREAFVSFKGRIPKSLGQVQVSNVWFSPDETTAVVKVDVAPGLAPMDWRAYGEPSKASISLGWNVDWTTRPFSRFELLDVRTGRIQPMVEAPVGDFSVWILRPAPNVFWSNDGRHAILVNSAIPLKEDQQRHTGYILDYCIPTNRWSILESIPSPDDSQSPTLVGDVRWSSKEAELRVVHMTRGGKPSGVTIYSLVGDSWTRNEADAVNSDNSAQSSLTNDVSVEVRQSANDPPLVVARAGSREAVLADPDYGIEGVSRAHVAAVQWTDSAGWRWSGGLMLPRASSDGQPPPLVIQVEYFFQNRFAPDGAGMTAFAAQPLVSAGFAVLRMTDGSTENAQMTPREGPSFVAGMDSAVKYLAAGRKVDPMRVGLIGFSRTGYLVDYAITHPGAIRVAAAVSADPGDPGYIKNLMWPVIGASPAGAVSQWNLGTYGGSFWEQKAAWIKGSPGFNADQATAPLLVTIGGVWNLPSSVELYSAFLLSGHPVEFLNFPQGRHQLVRPRERLVSLNASVDWMKYWLKGERTYGVTRSEQYERWDRLKKEHTAPPAIPHAP